MNTNTYNMQGSPAVTAWGNNTDNTSVHYEPMLYAYAATPVEPPAPRNNHKCMGIKAAKEAAKEAAKAERAAYLRGVAADLIGKRLDFVFHLFAEFHAAKVEAAMTHKRGRVAGETRLEKFIAKVAKLHGVTEYPIKDIVDAFTATIYPAAVDALTRSMKRRRQEYRAAVDAKLITD